MIEAVSKLTQPRLLNVYSCYPIYLTGEING